MLAFRIESIGCGVTSSLISPPGARSFRRRTELARASATDPPSRRGAFFDLPFINRPILAVNPASTWALFFEPLVGFSRHGASQEAGGTAADAPNGRLSSHRGRVGSRTAARHRGRGGDEPGIRPLLLPGRRSPGRGGD